LRALADVAPPAEVNRFWDFCRQHLESSSQGWPGQKNFEILSGCCLRSRGRGSWGAFLTLQLCCRVRAPGMGAVGPQI
jgi:hypothetical protein